MPEIDDVTPAQLHQQLRGAGMRVTAPRVAVLQFVHGHPHSTADAVASHVREHLGGVSTQTVYDVLRTCADKGLLRRIEPAGSAVRYETRTGDNHHHLVCRVCGDITDVDCVVGAAPCLNPDHDHGYLVEEAEITFWGLCPRCRGAAPASAEPEGP
ncbi:putative Fur family transcriptional regulator [Gordonia polyisoprenivorans NBRC 16320 = JCM 10675]|uniref:Transcriptional repressor n=1 Tax=Gordonia polyisoprenivorans TaxID=84595 RepID=A0A846WFP3_9ACTN|nr:Fur family transcriptional regulator [Gordonia polyisoprenivorans]NKY00612.1 transcriptional repressor [Gordonia polyisoprenivorans]WCB38143.1 Fur family transcriptional regulator [Gordonia polyisoprenivorans]GAB22891.1 putative Fur family transcriptional regulator [Gordonia polyisoprenivorans NBRC 16320 = JCM 10675]